jgi:hypothetical protein
MKPVRHEHHIATRRKTSALILITLMMLSMIVSALHFTLVPHSVDLRTGKVVHEHSTSTAHSSHDSRHSKPGKHKDSDSSRECKVFALLQQVKIFQSDNLIDSIQQCSAKQINQSFDMDIYFCRSIYPISPSNSPPA